MPKVTKYEPGKFCWAELATTDSKKAKAFYSEVLGWKTADEPAGPDMVYTMCLVGGQKVAAMFEKKDEQPHWNIYVSVQSADDTAKKAAALGSKVLAQPFDVFDAGRMAVIEDPQGAIINIWQPKKHPGFDLVGETGATAWFELLAKNTAVAEKFYTGLFGWTAKKGSMPDGSGYTEWHVGATGVGGMMQIAKEWGHVPPHWYTYFEVADVDTTCARITKHGGKVTMGPENIPNVGRVAMCLDSQMASFAIYKK
jgi:predicted enzyme related to lactoylglutathione lyase